MMTTKQAIELASHHVARIGIMSPARRAKACAMFSSAQLCLQDALTLADNGDALGAIRRASHSLSYSVGILHDDFKAVDAAYVAAAGRAPSALRFERGNKGAA